MPGDIAFRMSDIVAAVTMLGLLVTICINMYTLRAKRRESDPWMIEMRGDLKHIREKVDDQGIMVKRIDDEVGQMRERLAVYERDLKSMWRNIDELKGKK